MVGIIRIMAMTALVALVLSGCANRGDWAGEWRGTRPIVDSPGTDPLISKSLASVTLIIKKDGHFDLTEETFGKSGSSTLGSDTGTLVIDTILGRRPANLGPNGQKMAGERTIKLQKDGTMLYLRPDSEPVVLKRTSQKPGTGAQ